MSVGLSLNVVKRAHKATRGYSLFAIVRNESYFLTFFFEHYRDLGVENFLVFDDASDDETHEILQSQADCTIIKSDKRFADTFGTTHNGLPRRLPAFLKERMPERAFSSRWTIVADADEFLILPTGFSNLRELTKVLDEIGQPYLTAPMVDFYGTCLNDRNYGRTIDPFVGCPYFDAGPYYDWSTGVVPQQFPAGVRFRLLRMLIEKRPDIAAAIYQQNTAILAKSWKVPLLKHGMGIARIADHEVNVTPSTAVTGAIAHFKFYPDLDQKIACALSEGQYFRRSVEYRFLDAAIRLFGDLPLRSIETRRYSGPRSIEDARLMSDVKSELSR